MMIIYMLFRQFIIGSLLVTMMFCSDILHAQTCVFNAKIRASDDPFAFCMTGTDTILIRDTFVMDVSYIPLLSGLPFDGVLLLDGGVIYWPNNVKLGLGANACIRLKNNGHLYPNNSTDPVCNDLKTIYLDLVKYGSCSGIGALHSFSEINDARCAGTCCDSTLNTIESTPNLNINALVIEPNPSKGDFTVKSKVGFLIKSIEILDLSGRCCAKFQDLNTIQFEVKRHKLVPGVYFAQIILENGLVTKKVVLR